MCVWRYTRAYRSGSLTPGKCVRECRNDYWLCVDLKRETSCSGTGMRLVCVGGAANKISVWTLNGVNYVD